MPPDTKKRRPAVNRAAGDLDGGETSRSLESLPGRRQRQPGCPYGCLGYHALDCPLSRRGSSPERCNECLTFSFDERDRLVTCRDDPRCPYGDRTVAAR